MAGHYYRHWEQVPEGFWEICENFHPRTDKLLCSPDDGSIYFDIPSFMALQDIRDHMGVIKILSGYRSRRYNARVRGTPLSQHTTKIAFDLRVWPYDFLELERQARASGFTGIGRYPHRGFIHVDMGRPRTWYGSTKDKRVYQQLISQQPTITL